MIIHLPIGLTGEPVIFAALKAVVDGGVPVGIRYKPAVDYPGLMMLGGGKLLGDILVWNHGEFKVEGHIEAVFRTDDHFDNAGTFMNGKEQVIHCAGNKDVVFALMALLSVFRADISAFTRKE